MSSTKFTAVTVLLLAACCPTWAADESTRNPVSGSVPRDGLDLHYRVVGGKGPYIVILAGGPGLDVDYMASVTDELAKTHRCVLLEQRGTGRSKLKTVDEKTVNWDGYLGDLEALRKHLKEEKLTLLGHSWGMAYGLAYAGEYPERCRAVVTIGSCPITVEYGKVFDDNRASRLHSSEREVFEFWSNPVRSKRDADRAMWECLRAITPTDFFDRKKGIEHAARWRVEWCHASVALMADKTLWKDHDLRPKLKKVTCPVLFVHGYQDVTGEANMLEAKASLKDCKLKFVHRCGHYAWLEQPEETWKAVLPFLDKLPR